MHYLQIGELGELIRARAVSPVEVTETVLNRISAHDGDLHSYVHVMAAQARADAQRAERNIAAGRWQGPLHGVPVAVKDQFWVAGTPTAAGTVVWRDNVTAADSDVVRRLRLAGAIIVGKLAMSEAAFGHEHPAQPAVVNPWDPDLWEGSSSTGAGAAIAAGLCFGAIATDTGGSIRYPAAMTGLSGLKPTRASVSSRGVQGSIPGSMEHIGPMARSARDCEILFEAIADRPFRPAAHGNRSVRIGIDPSARAVVDEPTRAVLAAAEEVIGELGYPRRQVELPDPTHILDGWRDRCAVDLAVAHERTFPSRREEYGPIVADLLDRGRTVRGTDLRRILNAQGEFTARLDQVFETVDVLLLPALGIAAPARARIRQLRGTDQWREQVMRWTVPFNVSGHPTVVLPGGVTAQGHPIGFQLVAATNNERALLDVARLFQAHTSFHRGHPPAFA